MKRIVITPRQINILTQLTAGDLTRAEIEAKLAKTHSLSKVTVIRDLAVLIRNNYVEKKGKGPKTIYTIKTIPSILPLFDIGNYFETDVDKRNIIENRFNAALLNKLATFFLSEEILKLESTKKEFIKRISDREKTLVKKELERFIVELSWKSSEIEGNTYSLLDTENLLKNGIEATNHTQQEKQMILNHKKAFDYTLENLNEFKGFSVSNLQKIHSIMVRDLGIGTGFRNGAVGITGTRYMPLDNKYQIEDAIDIMVTELKKIDSPIIRAFGVLLFLSYIQPFSDGNKRTARMLSNAILIANDYYPLSYRGVDEVYYKKALILFYEQYNVFYFKKIFIEQYDFSVKNYFL